WTPTLEQIGPYSVTVYALAGELAATRTTTVTALFKADVAVSRVTPTVAQASPGEEVTLRALVTNTGVQADSFTIAAVNSVGWTILGLPSAPIALAAGESTIVELAVVADPAKPISFTTVSATSVGDGTTTKSVHFRVDIPVVVALRVDNITAADSTVSDRASGVVTVTHLDGTPAVGALVTVTQTPPGPAGQALRSTKSGTANQTGVFTFDFTRDAGGMVPGVHQLIVVAKKQNGYETVVFSSYRIGA
ncbi:MAG TPA: hypothetical protein VM582_00475, partial [Candidatus Thermoplasmatota archaeon]|nr:hypothetical protein [Candidatus Thermoplasmatota archaeon]